MSRAASKIGPRKNPFPGLRPFREDEEYLFFGRENQVDAMVDKLAATRFLGVVGGSGSGKSSLVNCGLRPALHAGLMAGAGTAWRMAQFRPGSDPMSAMAQALAADGVLFRDYQAAGLTLAEIVDTTLRMSKLGLIDIYEQANLGENVNLLVVVDQFEELFRYRKLGDGALENDFGVNEEDSAFVNLLLEAKKQTRHPIYVVLTMRSDFLGDCAHFPGLAEAVNAGQYLVPRMTRDERRAAICGPAGVFGADISPVLLTRLVNDVGDNPDQLSILQHALNRTWNQWQHSGSVGPLDLPHYEAIGTMARALDQHAEKAYAELGTARQREICKKVFKALTDKATDPRGVRRPTTLRDLCALAGDTRSEVAKVIEVFRKPSRSFLMPPVGDDLEEDTVIDISHESLMRVWERLKTWADEEARSARIYTRLASTAVLHDEGHAGRLGGPELQLALKWREDDRPNEVWAKRYHSEFTRSMEYLKMSERARRRRRVTQIGITVLIFAVLAGFFIYALWAERDARQQAIIAEALSAKEQLAAKPSAGLIAAIVSADEAKTTFSRAKMPHEVLSTYIEALQVLRAGGVPRNAWSAHNGEIVTSVKISDDGGTIVSGGWDGQVRRWNIAGIKTGAPNIGETPGRKAVEISADGNTAVVAGENGVWIADMQSGASTRLRADDVYRSADISADGKVIALASETKQLLMNSDGQLISNTKTDGSPGNDVTTSISGDGQSIVRFANGKVRLLDAKGADLWKTDTADQKQADYDRSYGATSATISRDGQTIVIGYRTGYVEPWKRDGESFVKPEAEEEGGRHDGKVTCVAISADGQTIISGGEEGTVRVWNLEGKSVGRPLAAHAGRINAVDVSADGKLIVSTGDDGIVRLWERPSPRAPLRGFEGQIDSIAFSGDGNAFLTAGPDARVLRWEREGGQEWKTSDAASGNRAADSSKVTVSAYSPGGGILAIGHSDGKILLRRIQGAGEETQFSESHAAGVTCIAFSGDGKIIASGDEIGTVRLWDREGKPVGSSGKGHEGSVASVALSADGKTVASGGADGRVVLWDSAMVPNVLNKSYSTGLGETVAVSPDGKTIVSGSELGMMRLWNVDGTSAAVFKAHEANIGTIAFSLDGEMIVSAADDGAVRLWDRRGKAVGGAFIGQKAVTSVALSPDGTVLVSGDSDGFLIIRQVGIDAFLHEACDWLRYHRRLIDPETDTERKAAAIAARFWEH